MKLRMIIIATAAVVVATINFSSHATTLLADDAAQVSALHKRMIDFVVNLGQIELSMARSNGPFKEQLCLMRISDQAGGINLYLYGANLVVPLASKMADPTDEMWLLVNALSALSALSDALENAKKEINEIFGRCQSRLVYDQAKSLLDLTEETRKITVPMLKRVQAALPTGFGR